MRTEQNQEHGEFSLDEILNEYGSNKHGSGGHGSHSAEPQEAPPRKTRTAAVKREAHTAPPAREVPAQRREPVQRRDPAPRSAPPRRNAPPEKNTPPKKRGPGIPPVLIVLVILAAAVIAAGLFVTYGGRILPNVCADTVALGGKSSKGAYEALMQSGWQERTDSVLTVRTYQDVAVEVDPVEAGIVLKAEDVVSRALRYGKDGGIFANLVSFFRAFGTETDINAQGTALNTAYIQRQAELCQTKLDEALGELYRIDEENAQLVLVKGQGSMFLNTQALQTRIAEALQNGETELEFKELLTDPVSPDLELIHSLVCTGAQDAYFSTDGTHAIIEGKPGYEFSTAEAKTLWDSAAFGDTVRIPLEISYSTVTAEYLETMMFHDLLGAATTKYNNSGENRRSNVRLAASKIDGVILYPGEEFSFNDIVGERTEEAGFLYAPAYAGYNDIKEEIGGGVCQVSSSLYAASLFAFLDITKHTCHVYPPNYIQLGTDATVTIPAGGGRSIDFRFVNNKNCPVKIVAYCEEVEDRGDGKPLRTITVEIWGTLEEDDYMPVEFDNSYINIYDYDRTIEPAYPDREGYKIKFTHDEQAFEDDNGSGIRTATHRKVYDSKGNLVEDKIINPTYSAGYALDTYYYMQ